MSRPEAVYKYRTNTMQYLRVVSTQKTMVADLEMFNAQEGWELKAITEKHLNGAFSLLLERPIWCDDHDHPTGTVNPDGGAK